MAGKWYCLPPRTPAPRGSCSGAQGSCHTCRTLMFLNFDLFISLARGRAKSLQLYLTLCDPVDCSPPSSSVHGIVQARILEWVTMTSCRVPYQPRDQNSISCSSYIAGGFFTIEPPGKPQAFLIPCLWFFVLFCFVFTKEAISLSYKTIVLGRKTIS